MEATNYDAPGLTMTFLLLLKSLGMQVPAFLFHSLLIIFSLSIIVTEMCSL